MQQAAEPSGPLAADQQICANAAWQVGDWYQAGLGEPKKPALATQWWLSSARLGNISASYQLRMMCQEQHQGRLVSDCFEAGSCRRRLAETAMYRFKQLLARKISLRNYNDQVGEVMTYVRATNKLMEWSLLPKTASNVPKW